MAKGDLNKRPKLKESQLKEATLKDAIEMGLTEEEFDIIIKRLKRKPNYTELGILSALWSEHCSYKSSRIHLKKFPTEGDRVIQGPGENAGAIDIGGGYCAVFKIESHNHPSYIEPYQGAATGVGGILRDIFTMGARPVANLNSLRFGNPQSEKTKFLISGVVKGIGDYGNCVGVPTVGGECKFDKSYENNCLVNAFTLGIAKIKDLKRGTTGRPGNLVVYIGSKTGKDGIHGATMASEEFSTETESKRPAVQVGDPFTEKLLLEACLELIQKGLVVGIQDMGAAGLSSSSFEMANRSNTGMILYLDRIPVRQSDLGPYELMLSESQERMLLIIEPDKKAKVFEILNRWEIDGVVIGEVCENKRIAGIMENRKVFDLPVDLVVEDAPIYERPYEKPANISILPVPPTDSIGLKDSLVELITSADLSYKAWIWEQYDHMVQISSVVTPHCDASVVWIREANCFLAMTLDCDSFLVDREPKRGAMMAVFEAARNIVSSGGWPVGVSDCLNFANPERKDVMYQFKEAVEGIADACRILDIPVVSGNVSFYNETEGKGIKPTPVVAMVGIIKDRDHIKKIGFCDKGHHIYLVGTESKSLSLSAFTRHFFGEEYGRFPEFEPQLELLVLKSIYNLNERGLLRSIHDVSEGGLLVALTECALFSEANVGFSIEIPDELDDFAFCFSEDSGRFVVTVDNEKRADFEAFLSETDTPFTHIGVTTKDKIEIKNRFVMDLKDLKNLYFNKCYFSNEFN